ncbi:MAG: hypothetical protein ACAH95_02765 [Fimbriimonas sp.]
MQDKENPNDLKDGLEQAMKTMEELQHRLEGTEVDERELTMLSKAIATQIEKVRAALEETVGSLDPDHLREVARKQLSPEDFEEWLAAEEGRKKRREELKREEQIAKQLGDE